MSNKKQKLIVILGYTGSGKSELAVKLAEKFNGEIISADSRQIYKEADMATGKVPGQWIKGKFIYQTIPHHLIDFLPIKQYYSAAEFKEAAELAIINISKQDKLPIIAGGTAQFIYSLIDNWQIPRVVPNQKFRQKLEEQVKSGQKTVEDLWVELIKQDPLAPTFIDKTSLRRIIRALEVIKMTGEKFSAIRTKKPSTYDVLKLGLRIDRLGLYSQIDSRVDKMVKHGLAEEAEKLIKKYGADAPGIQTIGYKEFIHYLARQTGLAETIQQIKFNSHKYVRYQNSWFSKDQRIKWVINFKEALKITQHFLRTPK